MLTVRPPGLALSAVALGCSSQKLLLLLLGETCTGGLWVGASLGPPRLALLGGGAEEGLCAEAQLGDGPGVL